ncbi:NAD(P)/FAD-dependent oxidoreductase [Neorhizobium galegae]|uniref:Putative D-amino-acid dehydrogenase (DadA) n=1 Tax=Neorhizobium galegae bv. officinalis TaxID=323656 RepID=A0A0T7H481_NEOGA|nr:FAD-binding oxidoreductase [Neorhizobium galegae]CDZ54334.1 Putative D-amino-acid dehydrogenase (DadA) [Neorhizobium galegae bv. officinalis]
MHVVVIGAGIVGASTALELLKDGHEVTIVEPEQPGGRHAASYGNSGWLSPASIIPMSMPGLWRKVPGYLADPSGPLTIRWRHLVRLAPWLLRFMVAGSTGSKVERTARILASLLNDAPSRHAALAGKIGRPDLIHRKGLLYVYQDRVAFEAEAFAWRLRRDNGVSYRELSSDELHELEPNLSPRYSFAAFVEDGGHCVDPGGYVAAMVDHAVDLGAQRIHARATGFNLSGSRLSGVRTEAGIVACDKAVIAAGIHSKKLAALAGDTIPMQSERGYHVVVPYHLGKGKMPIMPSDGRMGNNPTLAGLRIAGQVELASVEERPNWTRADILLKHAKGAYPALSDISGDRSIDRWMGHRPSTADGLPVIGFSGSSEDIVHAFGHGHVGLAAGPVSGALVADLIAGRECAIDLSALSAARFR